MPTNQAVSGSVPEVAGSGVYWIRRAIAAAEAYGRASTRQEREMQRRIYTEAYREWTAVHFPAMTPAEFDARAGAFDAGIQKVYG